MTTRLPPLPLACSAMALLLVLRYRIPDVSQQGPFTCIARLAPGNHYWQVRVDGPDGRFDLDGASWGFAFPLPADHWRADYFANRDLAGSPARIVDEGTGVVDHSWGTDGPEGLCGLTTSQST